MRSVKFAAFAAAAFIGLGLTAAYADQTASVTNCLSLAEQVKTALSNNSQSSNYEAAKQERNYGLEFCNASFYSKGVAHYQQALKLLGVDQKADAAMSH